MSSVAAFRYDDALLTTHTQEHTVVQMNGAIASVEEKIAAVEYGFMTVLQQSEYVEQIRAVYEHIKWAKTMVVVGIGGSDLGARAIQQALGVSSAAMEVIFHGDSTDPVQIERLQARIKLDATVFVIISKSGETVETISQYVYFKAVYQQAGLHWTNHFVFITDPNNGILRTEADRYGVATLPIPAGVGGRFSVLTTVGLLPALAMGVDIEALLAGARQVATDVQARRIAQEIASSHFLLYQQGLKVVVVMPYSIQLEEFARWFRQLWAESLGKAGKGILPIQARGPADQHSQVQFYSEGESLLSLLFIKVAHRANELVIPPTDISEVQYLSGHTFHEIINNELDATALALFKQGRPSAVLEVSELTPASLGGLFMLFELGVVYLAEMLGVNAFDQPGVEEGKQMMYALLGKAGFENKKAEIDQLRTRVNN
jgi:glucose-6-phosphate isomerase